MRSYPRVTLRRSLQLFTQLTGALFFLAVFGDSAFAQNVVTIDFNQCKYEGKLCRDGNSCKDPAVDALAPAGASASPQDILRFINVPATGITIDWSVTNPAPTVVPGDVQQTPATGDADGQNYSVVQGATSNFSTGPRAPGAGGVYQTKIDVNGPNNQAGFDYALVTYVVSCKGAPPPPANKGRINIVKNAIGGDGAFTVNISNGGGNVNLSTTGGFASDFRDLDPGTYTISETPPPGWALTGINCQIDSGPGSASGASVTLQATTVATCTVTNTLGKNVQDQTRVLIRDFLDRRVDLLASNEPDRARMLRRFDRRPQPVGSLKDGPMKLMGSEDSGAMSFATSLSQIARANLGSAHGETDSMRLGATSGPSYYTQGSGLDIWAEGHFQRFDDELGVHDQEGKFGILYFGADYLVSRSILVGALVQFDWMDQRTPSLSNAEVEGRGWMAGPYATVRLSENIYLDARAAWGESDNDITPIGTYKDSFDTERWLAKTNLTGDWSFGALSITPSAGVIYVEETAETYVDSLGNTITGQSVRLGRLTFGPEFRYQILNQDGSLLVPHVSVTGMWDFDKNGDDTTIVGLTSSESDFRVKTEAGVLAHDPNFSAASFRATVSYDGIADEDFSAWGGQVWVNWPLN